MSRIAQHMHTCVSQKAPPPIQYTRYFISNRTNIPCLFGTLPSSNTLIYREKSKFQKMRTLRGSAILCSGTLIQTEPEVAGFLGSNLSPRKESLEFSTPPKSFSFSFGRTSLILFSGDERTTRCLLFWGTKPEPLSTSLTAAILLL